MKIVFSFYFEILAFLVSIFSFRRLRGSFMVLFIPYLAIVVLTESIMDYLYLVLHKPNNWLNNIFIFIEVPFWVFFLRSQIHYFVVKQWLVLINIAFLVFAFINYCFIQGLIHFNSYSLIAGEIIIIFACCCYFYNLLKTLQEESLVKNGIFWIVAGTMLYGCGILVFLGSFEYMMSNDDSFNLMMIFNNVLIIVHYALISIGLLLYNNPRLAIK